MLFQSYHGDSSDISVFHCLTRRNSNEKPRGPSVSRTRKICPKCLNKTGLMVTNGLANQKFVLLSNPSKYRNKFWIRGLKTLLRMASGYGPLDSRNNHNEARGQTTSILLKVQANSQLSLR